MNNTLHSVAAKEQQSTCRPGMATGGYGQPPTTPHARYSGKRNDRLQAPAAVAAEIVSRLTSIAENGTWRRFCLRSPPS